MTAPRAREHADPPAPPDLLPPRRGGRPSIKSASAGRPPGLARPRAARRSPVRSAGALAAVALLALSGALALPATAEAQATFVSNIDQTDAEHNTNWTSMSQAFTTGANFRPGQGHLLTVVDIDSASTTAFTAWVCKAATDGKPVAPCTELTAPTIAVGTNSFTAPNYTTLTETTTYTVVVSAGSSSGVDYGTTASNEETGYVDWSIADGQTYYSAPTDTITAPADASWTAVTTQRLRIAIKGFIYIGTPDPSVEPTLSALSVTGGGSELVTNFASDTTDYTALVANSVDEVTITATTSPFGLIYQINVGGEFADDADSMEDGVQVPLVVGVNVLELFVLNADKIKVYTVTVTRAAALPALSIGDAEATEGSSVSFTVALTPAAAAAVTVAVATSVETGDTATSGTDFTAKTETLTFAAGETEKMFTVATTEDIIDEDDETFTVTLSGASMNAQLAADPTATGTIDDDDPPVLSFKQASYTAAEGGSAVEVELTLTSALPDILVVTMTAEHGAGATAEDYTGISDGTSALFTAGRTRSVFEVTASDDAFDEADETVTFGFTIPSSADVTEGSVSEATLTLTDNDDPPTVTVGDAEATEGGKVEFEVTLSAVSGRDVTVDYATSVGTGQTATSGDFTAATGTLTILASDATDTGTVEVQTTGDSIEEENETFTLTISSPTNATLGTKTTATGTINDDDGTTLPTLSVGNASATEGSLISFPLTLSAAAGEAVTVTCTASFESGDTAVAADLPNTTGTTTINAGSTVGTCAIGTAQDTADEEDETFTVTLSNVSSNAQLATDPMAKGTINDDDDPPTVSVEDVSAEEGTALTFTVALSAASGKTVTVDWAASAETGDTATAGTDFTAVAATTLTFDAGQEEKTVSVQTTDDSADENDETFTVTLSNPTNATLTTTAATAKGTIEDDDGTVTLPTVSIADAEGDEDVGVEFTATLTTAVSAKVTATWTASIESGDTASAADLATTKTGAVEFDANATTATFTVPVTNDTTDEPDQTFTVTLSGVSTNAQLEADPTAEGTIDDDDPAPTLTVADLQHDENTIQVSMTVSISELSEKRVRFRLRQVDRTEDTASDADWNPPNTISFNSINVGVMSVSRLAVYVVNDTLDEDDETLTVEAYSLQNAQGSSSDREATITIVDDDPTPTVTVAPAAATEGDKVEFVVTLSAVSGRDVEVGYATSVATGDTAVSDTDFEAATGTLTILAADSTATGTVEVQTTEDDASESAETFTLTLSATKNVDLGTPSTATGTINNRATAAAAPTSFAAAVGNAQVTLTWDTPPTGVTKHQYQFKAGSAAYGGWQDIANSGVGGATSHTETGLTNEVEYTFQLRAVNADGESTAVEADPVTPTPGICDRTQKVHEAIVDYLEETGVTRTCAEVNVADLASITLSVEMPGEGITSLQAGDFAGLTNVPTLTLSRNMFTTLPARVFFGMTALDTLNLNDGALRSLPADVFTGLTALDGLNLSGNDLDSLDAGTFTGLTGLVQLQLQDNDLESLPAGVFSGLTSLDILKLNDNDLESLPAGVFTDLTALTILNLEKNALTALLDGVFTGLTAVTHITLNDNALTALPDGAFTGLTALGTLKLGDNPNSGDTLALTVTLEKVGTDQVRAKVLAGAPFAVDFTPTVVNGDLPASDTKLAVAAGDVDGTAVTVTRTSGTTAAVTVDIDLSTQPSLPANHSGYEFEKADSGLPKTILPDTSGPQNFTAKPGDGQAVLAWDAPASGSGVTKHQYRQKAGSGSYGNWIDVPNSAEDAANEDGFTVENLTNETAYTFELKRFVGTTESATAESNTVTPTPGICDRTQGVQDGILAAVSGADACNEVTVADLAGIDRLDLRSRSITSLEAGDFAGLTGMTFLNLHSNELTSLPGTVFSGLTALESLWLSDNKLTATGLPGAVFNGLTALEILNLTDNNLSSLPDGLFSGLTALLELALGDNPDSNDDLPLAVTLEKVGDDRVRAKVLAGAPFAVDFTPAVAHGILDGGATVLSVPQGSVYGTPPVTVTRTEGTTEPVTVDVDLTTQPSLPGRHMGYEFARSSDLPVEILPEEASLEPPTNLTATAGDRQAGLAWIPPAADSGYTRHEYRYQAGNGGFGDWTDIPDSGPGEANGSRYTVTELKNATEHTFELRAGDAGAGKSEPASVTVEPTGPPRIVSVAVVSGPGLDNGQTYGEGEEIRIEVTFDQEVVVTGEPELEIEVGDGSRHAQYDSGDGTEVLVFVYVVTEDDRDGDGIEVGDNAIRLGAGDGIGNGAGHAAELAHDGPGRLSGHGVDGGRRGDVHEHGAFTHGHSVFNDGKGYYTETYPEHTHAAHEHSNTANDHPHPRPGHTHHADENPHALISDGPDERPHGGMAHIHRCFDLKPRCNQGDDYKRRGDELGLPIEVTHAHASDAEPGHGFDWDEWFEGRGPDATGATVSVADAEAVGGEAAALAFAVTLEPAQAFAVRVDYATAAGTATAGEDYRETRGVLEIPPGQTRATVRVRILDRAPADGDETLRLTLGAATAATVAAGAATGTIRAPAPTTPPEIEGIGVVSTPRLWSRGASKADTYGAGETIRIAVRFDQPVVVEGEPVLALEVGDPCLAVCEARYESGDGTDTLVFGYLVLEGDSDRTGVAIPANPIGVSIDDLDGFRIRNAADEDADLSSRRRGTQRDHKADGSRTAAPHLSVADAEAHEADGAMAFTVRLEPRGLDIVTVDYATADGTAEAGLDYTETRGTLRFNPLDTARTVTVPIIDDAHEDTGETFTLTLSNPQGARLRSGDRAATGTIHNSDPGAAPPLTAAFEDLPETHDGSAFTLRLAFSEPLSWMTGRRLRADVVAVAGGRAMSAGRVDRRRDLWQVTVEPDSPADVTVTLAAGAACDTPAAVCTKDGRALSTTILATVEGPDEGPPPLTAAFAAVPAAHDGERAFRFRVAFSEPIAISYRSLREDAFAVTGGRVTRGKRVDGRKDLFEITVEPDGADEVAVALPADRACSVSGAICTWGPPRKPLTNTPTATVAGPPDSPATGAPGIAGTAQVGEELTGSTSGIADADGLDDVRFAYQWLRGDRDIDGATRSRYTAVDADEGERLTVRVDFTDDAGNRESLTSAATAAVAPRPEPLTASFADVPAEHDGASPFKVRIAFSDGIRMRSRLFRSYAVAVSGGRVTTAQQVDNRNDLWEITVTPRSYGAVVSSRDVVLAMAPGVACGKTGAVCTPDGRALSNTVMATVRGPVGLSVADARAEEGTDATLDFAVTLSRAAPGPVTVAYATADGTATAGSDYTETRGTLTFAPGETAKTVAVPVLDDAHDEGEETLTLTLTTPSGAVLADGEATGTIKNSDHMQQAWLARFGRTVATHVTDAVGDRLRGTPGQGSHLTVGGYRLPVGQAAAPGPPAAGGAAPGAEADTDDDPLVALVTGLAGVLGLGPGQAGGTGPDPWGDRPAVDPRLGQSRTLDLGSALNLRQVLLGSSFRLALGGDAVGAGGPRLTAWGRVAGTTFDGRDGALSLDGDVLTGTVGVDGEWDRLLAGLAVAHSRGDGSYTDATPDMDARGRGDLEQTLTSVHPYLRYAVTDRLAVWGLLGFGTGQMEMEVATGEIREADTDLLMGAFGGRGILLAAAESGGFQLATRTDAMLTRTSSDAVAGMASGDAEAHRLRLVLEGSRGFTWAEGRRLTPTMEVGLRHDWGDAETGFGLELGGRVQYADPALGLTINATVRGLLAHEDSAYQEWGASGTVRVAPGAGGQGLALTLAPTWGAASSGVDGLWSRQTTAGLAPQGTRVAPVGRLTAEIGYGVAAPFGTGLLTPYAGTVLSEGAARTYRVGTRLQLGGPGATGLTLNLEGTRQEPAGPQPATQGLRLQATWGF